MKGAQMLIINKKNITDDEGFYLPSSLGKSERLANQCLIDFNGDEIIIILDKKNNRSAIDSNQLREVLELDSKDKDDKKYLIFLPSLAYYSGALWHYTFKKSKHLRNKKYFFCYENPFTNMYYLLLDSKFLLEII